MDVRSPFFQNIATLLIGVMFLNPIVSTAADLAVDAAAGRNTGIAAAGNGVPVVNIATPNSNGLSHNTFRDYNVGQQGLILNNSAQALVQSQLGGYIVGNSNLKNGAANVILNEVSGSNQSRLNGYTEVAGQSAHVIVANPNGISCDGCGFINTPRATLTTGKPVIENGHLDRFDVDGGEIAIEGEGLNASNLDQFDLITRSATLNASLYANQLNVITGRNEVKADDLTTTAKADDGSSKPQLAIDSSALGGMYAGAIRLVGTEAGVGVRLAGDMAASAGDIQIDANGHLSLAKAAAARDIAIDAQSAELGAGAYAGRNAVVNSVGAVGVSQSLAAGQNIQINSSQVNNAGIVEAGVNPDDSRNTQGDIVITAQSLRNRGSVVASRNLEANVSGTLDNQGGVFKGADTRVTATTLDNRQGRLLASDQLSLNAASLDNRNGQAVANRLHVSGGALDNRLGLVSAEQALDFTLDSLDNSGKGNLVSNGTLQVRVQQKLDNQADGLVSAKGALGVQAGNLDNRGGLVVGDSAVTLSGGSLNNSALGVISSLGELKIDVGQLDNSQGGALDSGAALHLNAGLVNNTTGSVSAKGDLQAKADSFSQQGGELLAQGALNLDAGQLDNRSGGLVAANNGVTVNGTDLLNQGGEISSRAKVALQAASLDNGAGKVIGDAGLDLQVQRIANQAGTLAGRDGLSMTGQSLDNSQGGRVNSQNSVWLQLAGSVDNSGNGALLSQGSLILNAGSLDNRGGTVSSAGLLFSRLAGALDNRGGKLLSDGSLDLAGADLNNAGGILSAAGDISLKGAKLDNGQMGRIVTDAAIHLATAQLDNSQGGSLSARGVIDGRVTSLDQHGGGQLTGQGGIDLDLQGGALNNAGGLLGSPGQLVLRNVASLDNRGGEISSDRAFVLATGTLLNQGGKILSGDRLTLTGSALNNSSAGVLSGSNGLNVSAANLDNSLGGTLASQGDLLVRSQGALDNHGDGALVAGGKLDVGSASLNNQGGLVSATGDLALVTGTTDNRDGRLLAQGRLDATAADLDNRDGVISGAQGLDLVAGDVLNGASAIGKPGGLITSRGALTLSGSKLESTNGGEISAKGDLHLIVARLIQQQAALIGEGKVTLDLGNGAQRGDFDNRGGLLSAAGPLQINGLGSLDNRGGEISASQDFALTASGQFDNGDSGRIISTGQLELNADALRNAGQGLLSGWQGLVVNATSLDNSGGGTVSSRDGALTLTLSGALDNHGEGALVSKGALSLGAGSLNNAGGVVSTQGNLGLTLAGDLDNSAAGLLSTQGSLTGKTGALDNHGGQISAASIDYDASSLNNSGGSLVSQGALRLGLLGALLNNGVGSKLASGGALNLNVGSLENRAGQLVSQGLLKVLAGRFDNSLGGTVAAQNDLTLELTAELLNGQDGLIFSKAGQLDVSASSITNAGGSLQGQGDTTLTAIGAIDNQNGRVISQSGQLDLASASLDNSAGGVINAANGNLGLVTGQFSNHLGTTQAKALDIIASGGIDNSAGHLSAVSGDNRISTTDFNNQGGGLYAGNLLYLRGDQLLNNGTALGQGGKIGAGNIDAQLGGALNNQFGLIESTGSLSLGVASIVNVAGAIRALGQNGTTQVSASGLLNNGLGRIETSAQNLSLQAGGLQNGGGNVLHVGTGIFGVDLAQAGQAGGSFTTNGSLTYQADNWTNNAIIQARNLDLNIGQLNQGASGQLLAAQSFIGRGGNWANDGLIASDGTLDLNLGGNYTADGRLSSLGTLTLDAGYIGIGQSGSMGGGGATTLINSSGTLDNNGRLTGTQDLRVSATSLNNRGTLGSAGHLYLGAGNLLNENGLIFSGGNLQLRTQNLTNSNADLYSLGTLHIAANDQDAWASSVQNISGSFESGGAMTLLVQDFDNRRADDFQIGERIVSGSIQFKYDDVCDGNGCEVHFLSQERSEDVILKDAPQASITAGGDFRFRGGSFDNLYSSIGSGGNIDIQTATFRNQGAAGGVERHYNAEFYTRNDNRYWTFRANKDLYNRYNDPTSPDYDPGHLTRQQVFDSAGYPTGFYNITTSEVAVSGTPGASAVIQAAGDVVINASQSFDNSVVKRDAGAQSISPRDVGVANGATTVQLAITSQLPPDLAQKQVNPVTLPGFSLPQGENGLFRLSSVGGVGGSTDAVQGAGDISFSGQSISAAQRQGSIDGATADAGSVVPSGNVAAADAQSGAAFNVPRVQGLPSSATPSNSHKYLIETNPELTSLKSFLSSDYLLTKLGYDPDTAQKRLGDGLYEQRLIQQAVVARTGQRYIDDLASDEALFQYLMDNAIAYKDSLQLTVGMALSAEQVAALTHDIVWLEDAVVNGEKVLVPVLYLAQAEGRLAANGALIMGNDLSLISGGNLNNQGTLRASGDLAATAASLDNRGLIDAGNRLDLLATGNIRNAAGGIISGRDLSLTALTGDVINERSITSVDVSNDAHLIHEEIANNAARIEARGNLEITAGRDLTSAGSVIRAGGNAEITAGRDLRLEAAQEVDSFDFQSRRVTGNVSSVTQHGSEVQVGGNLELNAGRDLRAVASRIDAARDIALSAGRDVVLASAANEEHSDAKYTGGGKKVTTQEDHVGQQASVIEAGGYLDIAAKNDLAVSSSQLQAGNEAYLYAGGDIQLEAAQNEDYSYSYKMKKNRGLLGSKKKSSMSETSNSQAVSSTIIAGSDLTLVANNDITSRGAELSSDKAVGLYAGHDIVLDAAENSSSEAGAKAKSSLFSSKSSNQSSSSTSLTSTSVNGESVELLADNDITLRAAAVHADKNITLDAGRDVAISTAQQSQQSSQASKSSKLNWHLTDSLATNGSFTLENKGKGAEQKTVQEVGSTLSGGSIDVSSGRDTTVRASTLVADNDIRIDAGRNLSVVSGESVSTSSAKSKTKNAGEIGNWYHGATGVASLKETNQNSATTQTGSQIASLGGDVQLQAGERYKQVASQVVAPVGDVSISGKQVDIEAGYDTLSSTQKQSSSRTALGGSVSIPIVDAVRSIKNMGEAAQSTGDTRLKALAAVNIAMDAQRAYDEASTLGTDSLNGLKISVNLSNDKGSSSSTQSGQNVVASTVAAGGNVNIIASGAGKDSDLTVVGSEVSAGKNAMLEADGDINLLAAQNTAEQHSKNAGSGWSAGVGFALFGEQNGFTIDLAANKSRGNADGSDVAWTQTTIQAGNSLGFWSGEDTNLKGAIVRSNQVVANIGGDLNLESVQDTSTYKSKQANASVGVSLCIPPFCYGAPVGSGSASFGQQKIDSEYASVTQQSGIKAGDKGFDITVGGNTDLKGAVIASTDKAVTDGKNTLTTGSLTHSDIKNKAEYDATSMSLSGGYTGETHDANGNVIKAADGKPKHGSGATATMPIVLNASDDAKSTTHSGISGGTITVTDAEKQKQLANQTADEAVASIDRDVSSDKDGSNALKPIFDRKEIEAGFEITEAFVRNVGTFLEQRAYESADAKRKLDAEKAKPESERNEALINQLQYTVDANKTWEMGGVGRTLVSALSGAVGANVTGGGSQLLQGAAVNYLQSLAAEQVKRIADDLDSETARTALHAVVGCAGAAAQNQSCGAGAIGASVGVVLNNLLDKLKDETASGLTDTEKQNRLNLIGTLVAGITTAAGGEAAVATNAAQIEAANNHLDVYERLDLKNKQKEYAKNCQGGAAASSSCQSLKKDIDQLMLQGQSILAEDIKILGSDMGQTITVKNSPGDVVSCSGSSNGYCLVSDQPISGEHGQEWMLVPASDKEAQAAKDHTAEQIEKMNLSLKDTGLELYNAGCDQSVLCLGYKVIGGENPFTGEAASDGDRILSAVSAALTLAGIVGTVKIRVVGSKGTANALETTNPIVVSGSRAIDKAQSYESGVRGMYGGTKAFDERQFRAVVDGKVVNGVADDVAIIGGKKTAVEAKFVEDWGSSLRNPASQAGSKPWSVAEQAKMVDQAKKYSSGFDGGVVYHTNSPELASYYSKLFADAGVTKFKFVITPAKN